MSGTNLRDTDAPPEGTLPSEFVPDADLVEQISGRLQVHRAWVAKALFETSKDRPQNRDAASVWVLENHPRFELIESSDDEMESAPCSTEYKMVFVVNSELNMGVGKIAAQVAHGAIDLYELLKGEPEAMRIWESNGSKKVVVKIQKTEDLILLKSIADSLNLKNTIISDAGLTEVPRGSYTVLALFGKSGDVNENYNEGDMLEEMLEFT